MRIEDYVRIYRPSKKAMEIVNEIFKQDDWRYSDPWKHVAVAGFITHDAIIVSSTPIRNPGRDRAIQVKGTQKELKRIAAWLLKTRAARIESFEKEFSGGIVDVIGKKGDKHILIECGPCRISKAIDYLESPDNLMWVLTNRPTGIVLYEIKRGENWDSFLKYHQKEESNIMKNSIKRVKW